MGLFQWLWKGLKGSFVEHADQRLVKVGDRDYVENAPYVLPKDEQEIDRLDLQHYVFRYMLRENYVAPLKHPNRVLDIGCGTGRWAIEIAKSFPSADIVGLDIVKPTLDAAQRPANVLFLQRDVLKGLPFTDQTFDYTHMRFLIGALPVTDFQNVVNEMSRVTTPGGWIELAEPGMIINAGVGLQTLWGWLIEFGNQRNIDLAAKKRLDTFLKDAGLTNISYKEVTFPLGDYAGQSGHLAGKNILILLEAVRAPILGLKIATASDYDMMLSRAKAELSAPKGSCSAPMRIAIAQKK
ncbi:hypothetical protein KDA_36750 [Dictyobacter alpinus]|uniref:Methyltransferase domain-containing protein n=1 Tax=Dictyobacter alpinus TaxID=2014873 RepID=A0A402B9X4_9CHLR|nr:class I SAM-dependent methyltransferase [Dictyobacter alpinus]GCE28191.1 hypothetical protein KDA_36750 [Dictyobacter alpinus]